jgi:hypothetical protein
VLYCHARFKQLKQFAPAQAAILALQARELSSIV